jgi:hypothetical protein
VTRPRSRGRHHEVVLVAIHPILARLERLDHRMVGAVVVSSGMFVRRAIAASDMTAIETQPQVNPLRAALETLLTALGVGSHLFEIEEMSAS